MKKILQYRAGEKLIMLLNNSEAPKHQIRKHQISLSSYDRLKENTFYTCRSLPDYRGSIIEAQALAEMMRDNDVEFVGPSRIELAEEAAQVYFYVYGCPNFLQAVNKEPLPIQRKEARAQSAVRQSPSSTS